MSRLLERMITFSHAIRGQRVTQAENELDTRIVRRGELVAIYKKVPVDKQFKGCEGCDAQT